jgi:hypothetical protein
MPTKAKDAETVALAEAMLRELGALREQAGGAYPPRLRQLAALTGGSLTDEQIQKAAAKTVFTAAAVVSEKVARKPSLDAHVYFKDDAPTKQRSSKRAAVSKKDDGAELAGRMLLVLEAQKRLGAEAYPPTLRRLAELCELNASDTRVTKAAGHKGLAEQAVVAAKAKGKPILDAPVVLRHDIDGGNTTILPALLRFALAPVAGGGNSKATESTAFTLSEAKGRLVPELQEPVLKALERGIERQELPEDVAWVVTRGKPYVFLTENLRPGAARLSRSVECESPTPSHVADGAPHDLARPARDFDGAFREAFEQLDRRNGATNFVKLADLRHTLAEFGREEFDFGLRKLRLGGEFSLDSHEGLHGSLTPEERDAGVREAGSLLIYVSRR